MGIPQVNTINLEGLCIYSMSTLTQEPRNINKVTKVYFDSQGAKGQIAKEFPGPRELE
jgi:hypothetical protein